MAYRLDRRAAILAEATVAACTGREIEIRDVAIDRVAKADTADETHSETTPALAAPARQRGHPTRSTLLRALSTTVSLSDRHQGSQPGSGLRRQLKPCANELTFDDTKDVVLVPSVATARVEWSEHWSVLRGHSDDDIRAGEKITSCIVNGNDTFAYIACSIVMMVVGTWTI